MSNLLQIPSLGPIVGHTTARSVRIWARGPDNGDMRTVGVAALYKNSRYVGKTARYFRLRREYDRTGTVDFADLAPDSAYQVRIGCIVQDHGGPMSTVDSDELEKLLPPAARWAPHLGDLPDDTCQASFSTFPEQADNGFSFLFGSCRYPGFFWDRKRSDKIFQAMADACAGSDENRPRFSIMVGDQIYADLLNRKISIGLADTPKEFHDRHMEAFGSPNMRRLLRSVPNYMMLDDHEIEDNWVKGRIKIDKKRQLFLMAIAAFRSFQWYHSPRTYKNRLCYRFDYAGHPFFVMDQRTQRIRDAGEDRNLADNHLMGRPRKNPQSEYKGQVDLFCDWLKEQQDTIGAKPKFAVSPSVFAPNDANTVGADEKKWNNDSWAAYPVTRRQVVKTIVEHNIQNVIFLSGDVHCSNCAEIYFKDNKNNELSIKAFDITSSAFYWPFPFADGDPLDFVHDSEQEGDGFNVLAENDDSIVMHYRAKNFQQDDNYTQVTVKDKQLLVHTFNRKGEQLNETVLELG